MDLDKIMKDLIKKSYPELINREISIEFENNFEEDDCYFIYGNMRGGGFFIEVEESLKNFDSRIAIGGIAHELCHIVWEISLPKYYEKNDARLYHRHLHHRQRDERYTDLETILRGYGSELRLTMEHYHKYPTKDYLAGNYCGLRIDEFKRLKI